ncbi:MAG: ribonuclease HI family protein [Candidatus Liptonbacteria bacterium]|nr:ribonuclease HI family protein [Candidatus Liptonbacteria bacterium]
MPSKTLFNREKIIIYTDGGSRGNPGPSALGVVIGDREYAQYLGNMTNNQAEYHAVIFALKKAKQLVGKKKTKEMDVEVRMDSELIVKQLNAEYKIEDPDLQPLFLEVWNLRFDFKKIDFKHVPREQNKIADKLVNQALDDRN